MTVACFAKLFIIAIIFSTTLLIGLYYIMMKMESGYSQRDIVQPKKDEVIVPKSSMKDLESWKKPDWVEPMSNFTEADVELSRQYQIEIPEREFGELLYFNSTKDWFWKACVPFRCSRSCSDYQVLHRPFSAIAYPPCCATILHYMLHDIHTILSDLGVTHMVTFGTLLGFIRDNHVMPFTADIDFTIPLKELKEIIRREDMRKVFINRGYVIFKTHGMARICLHKYWTRQGVRLGVRWPNKNRIKAYVEQHAYVDVYSMQEKTRENEILVNLNDAGACWTNKDLYFPAKNFTFRSIHSTDLTLTIPAKSEELLTRWYGTNWRIPVRKPGMSFYDNCANDDKRRMKAKI